jgi:hypothetical protein
VPHGTVAHVHQVEGAPRRRIVEAAVASHDARAREPMPPLRGRQAALSHRGRQEQGGVRGVHERVGRPGASMSWRISSGGFL